MNWGIRFDLGVGFEIFKVDLRDGKVGRDDRKHIKLLGKRESIRESILPRHPCLLR